MEKLIIEDTKETPYIELDGANGIFKFTGKSYPENVNLIYSPVLSYIEEYGKNPKKQSILEFKWLYFNTATSKIIASLVFMLKAIKTELVINWYCELDFDTMIEKGEEFRDALDINLNIINV